jgi:hypothetical protein
MTRQNEPVRSMLSANVSLFLFQRGYPQMFVAGKLYDPEPDASAFSTLTGSGGYPIPSRNTPARGQPLSGEIRLKQPQTGDASRQSFLCL